MNMHRVYKMPGPQTSLEQAELLNKSIDDILLTFEKYPLQIDKEVYIPKVVSVPYANGLSVVACQVYFNSGDRRTIVLTPDEDFYEFREAKIAVKRGLLGRLFTSEKPGFVSQKIMDAGVIWEKVTAQHAAPEGWYHFTGTPEELLFELRKRCALNIT